MSNAINLGPVQVCLKEMVEAYKILEDQKLTAGESSDTAYSKFSKTVEFGDNPPSQKALEKLAKAMAKDNLTKFSDDLKDVANALLKATGESTLPFGGGKSDE